MPSPFFDKLVRTVSSYIGEEKAVGAVSRRLKDCAATPESFAPPHLKKIMVPLTAALGLYLTDTGKKTELQQKLSALAG